VKAGVENAAAACPARAMGGPLPMRDGTLLVERLIELYMAEYSGRDGAMVQRLSWWKDRIGQLQLDQVSDDDIHAGLELLTTKPPRYFAGKDADGKAIYRAKKAALAPATVNRYCASIAAVFTWAVRRRIAPKGWTHPCRGIERRAENNEQTRFLSDDERGRLIDACKASAWPRMYLLVLLALTTGARRGELSGLRWRDVDLVQHVAHVGRSKNGDPKCLPLVASVVEQLARFKGAPSALVFPSPRDADRPYDFEPRWRQALKVAKVRAFRFHDLRHSCASYLAQNGATLLEIGDLLGHRQLSVTKRYSHLASTHRAALVNRVLGDLR
jgi:integrase